MICDKCGEEKVRFGDYTCKVCTVAYRADWVAKNRDRRNANSRAWVTKNKEKSIAIKQKYVEENRERILLARRISYAEGRRRRNYPDNPNVRRAIKHRRRARITMSGFDYYDPAAIFARDNNTCVYCGANAEHIEHIIPICKGGQDSPHNVAAACVRCNLSKHVKTAAEFMRPKLEHISQQLRGFN